MGRHEINDARVFEQHESNVRSYCRSFPTVFARARGAQLFDEAGRTYIDFFAGAGALNYGHNPPHIRERLIAYLESEGVAHALDMYTMAKRDFLTHFHEVVLRPRGLDYKVQFCGPTGANAVEAAIKLARRATGRHLVASFTGGWHGMTATCLSVTGNREHRAAAGIPLGPSYFLPYPAGPRPPADPLGAIEALLEDPNSGLDTPAAIILETVQAEGGIYVAPAGWLRGLRRLCDRQGVLLIVDDIQVGCGRTGTFFSFERAGIEPDIVCLSKSIGGYGLPMALVLMKRALDVWQPGQHTGTFRGNQLAFVAATAALDWWREPSLTQDLARRAALVESRLRQTASLTRGITVRGLGLIWGLDLSHAGGAQRAALVARTCFERGLIIERCGRDDTVLKVLPPLTIDDQTLAAGLDVLHGAVAESMSMVA